MKDCCLSPDVDSEGMCQTCFEKFELRGFFHGELVIRDPADYVRRNTLITPENAYMFLKGKEEGYVPRYGGYYDHWMSSKEMDLLFFTAGIERPVDGVRYRLWSAFGCLIIMTIAYFVTRFVGK